MTWPLGVSRGDGTTRFAVRAPLAGQVWLCTFGGGTESRTAMQRNGECWVIELPGDRGGLHYGFRAKGEWAPERGLWFDPAKLLVDPYAIELDRRFIQDPRLAIFGADTADIVPRAIVPAPMENVASTSPRFQRGGLIYELNVRGFTMLHPDVPEYMRGTIAALAHPAIIAHFRKLHVAAIELMPIVAWIDERHLPPLGLCNAWGYNPVVQMALDPGLAPGGMAELRDTVATLHAEGIGVFLDLVFNHTGESDEQGGVLSLRGLDNQCYATGSDGALVNHTGCGNMLDFARPEVRQLALATMRHFVGQCDIDGFRFDLAPIMARGPEFDFQAPIFAAIRADPLLADRVFIAEPWDIGPGGYRLGQFPPGWLEWNDRFRDDVRRFWRGDEGVGVLATRLAGSSDIFGQDCRSVNFLAAHDGFTLADTVSYAERHNLANGEQNRDGHAENFSWNHGAEGPSDDPEIVAMRQSDIHAMLATLFASTGTIMLCAGDEFGRTQAGNNNAYAQDNRVTWLDWLHRNLELEAEVARMAHWRAQRADWFDRFPECGEWNDLEGRPMSVAAWENMETAGFLFTSHDRSRPYKIALNRKIRSITCSD
ncbi:MAG: glycogen debranching protein GlgX [Novosphingobium sp.]